MIQFNGGIAVLMDPNSITLPVPYDAGPQKSPKNVGSAKITNDVKAPATDPLNTVERAGVAGSESPNSSPPYECCCKYRNRVLQARTTTEHFEREHELLLKIHKKLDIILKNSDLQWLALQKLGVVRPEGEHVPGSNFKFVPLENKEQLESLEKRLETEPEYKEQMQQYLQRRMTRTDKKTTGNRFTGSNNNLGEYSRIGEIR
uniref:Uncharacterized protein n=1 Tax=Anopheles culicifacies TaxID=139723 RepID=A0A182MG65_9DIPT